MHGSYQDITSVDLTDDGTLVIGGESDSELCLEGVLPAERALSALELTRARLLDGALTRARHAQECAHEEARARQRRPCERDGRNAS